MLRVPKLRTRPRLANRGFTPYNEPLCKTPGSRLNSSHSRSIEIQRFVLKNATYEASSCPFGAEICSVCFRSVNRERGGFAAYCLLSRFVSSIWNVTAWRVRESDYVSRSNLLAAIECFFFSRGRNRSRSDPPLPPGFLSDFEFRRPNSRACTYRYVDPQFQ